jgi:prepilin-type N-terminal cleavage/methylation domain-containing protein
MSLKNLTKNGRKASSGFTIIEVLIVLAIAGLILLIVFLAVPALQRNSRNTAIKNDVQNVLGGVAEFQGANNGSMPATITGTGTITYDGTNDTTINIQGSTAVTTNNAATDSATSSPATTGAIVVVIGKKCPATGTTLVASTRAVAALYKIETTSGTVNQCTDS